MIRSFHPIGQGAFYSEEFSGFTAVYDCGSDNGLPLVQKEIISAFNIGHQIDALFISHFHADHVNGLEFLLTHCNVERVFLPLIDDTERIQLFIHHSVTKTLYPFLERLILDPENAIADVSDAQVVFVLPTEEGGEKTQDRAVFLEQYDKETLKIRSGEKITSMKVPNWVFVPFNFQSSARSAMLATELSNHGLNFADVESFKNSWGNVIQRKSICDSYKAIPGGFNTNSMTLYSGPAVNANEFEMFAVLPRFAFMNCYAGCISHTQVGCLYLGDYEAKGSKKWQELHTGYKPYWNNIGIIQIPHHGSCHNYNDQLNKIQSMLSVISCGTSNRHRHPHSSTIRSIVMDGGTPIIVNESVGTRAQFQVISYN